LPPVSKKVTINGKEQDLFYVQSLAEALGRSSQTVRRWEIAGVIPPCLFKDKLNRRLYTQEQIDVIVRIAEECKIQQGHSLRLNPFPKKVKEALEELNKTYIGGNKKDANKKS